MAEKRLSLEKYKAGILQGDRVLLGRAITLIESNRKEDEAISLALIDSIFPFTGNSFRIGISGIPGVGKSTFIETLGKHLTGQGKKVAVLAIDPSSKLTGGSLLGDKTRMNELARNDLAFIRPTPASTTMGGVAEKTYETILLCEAAGFDYILIETVGVGQSETEVYHLADFFLLLMIAGTGDELQTMKKGIMELADAVVINKADGDNKEKAKKAAVEMKQSLHVLSSQQGKAAPPVLLCSSKENTGIGEINRMLDDFREKAVSQGSWTIKRAAATLKKFSRQLEHQLQKDFYNNSFVQENIKKIENEVAEGKMTPQAAAILLVENYKATK
jgi:LAO/AO transport system kinase